MEGLARRGVSSGLENAMKGVEDDVTEAEQSLLETEKMIDAVSRTCT